MTPKLASVKMVVSPSSTEVPVGENVGASLTPLTLMATLSLVTVLPSSAVIAKLSEPL